MPAVQIDALLDDDGDLPEVSQFVTSVELIQQRIRRRLRRGTGEWFLDPDGVGLPLIAWRQQKPPQVAQILSQVQAEIREVPGVIATANFDAIHDTAARRLSIFGDVLVDDGSVTSIRVTGPTDASHNTMPFAVFFTSGSIRGGIPRPSTGRP